MYTQIGKLQIVSLKVAFQIARDHSSRFSNFYSLFTMKAVDETTRTQFTVDVLRYTALVS